MARKAVIDAVEARLAALWSGPSLRDPILLSEPPADKSAFLVVQYPVANERQASLGAPGDNLFREEGVIRFVLVVPRRQVKSEGYAWADQIAALFRAKEFDGVRTFEASSPVLDDRNPDGGYFTLSVVVLYAHDITG